MQKKAIFHTTVLMSKIICAIELVRPYISHPFSTTVMSSDNIKSFFIISTTSHPHNFFLSLSHSHSLQTLKRTHCVHKEKRVSQYQLYSWELSTGICTFGYLHSVSGLSFSACYDYKVNIFFFLVPF